MIIAIAGEAGHGKDTIGKIIEELWAELNYNGSNNGKMKPVHYNEFRNIKFADSINKTISSITSLPLSMMTDRSQYGRAISWLNNKTIRTLKQEIGEGLKSILGNDVWAKSAFSRVGLNDNVIITDLRFPVELDACVSNRAIIILVERTGYIDDSLSSSENKNHTSETSVKLLDKSKINHIIINDGSRAQLKQRVKEALETHEVWKKEEPYSTNQF